MWDGMGGSGFWHGGGGLFAMLLFWGLVIFAIVLLARWLTGGGSAPPPARSALDILEERYARGEIGKEEYEQKRRDLER